MDCFVNLKEDMFDLFKFLNPTKLQKIKIRRVNVNYKIEFRNEFSIANKLKTSLNTNVESW